MTSACCPAQPSLRASVQRKCAQQRCVHDNIHRETHTEDNKTCVCRFCRQIASAFENLNPPADVALPTLGHQRKVPVFTHLGFSQPQLQPCTTGIFLWAADHSSLPTNPRLLLVPKQRLRCLCMRHSACASSICSPAGDNNTQPHLHSPPDKPHSRCRHAQAYRHNRLPSWTRSAAL